MTGGVGRAAGRAVVSDDLHLSPGDRGQGSAEGQAQVWRWYIGRSGLVTVICVF